MKDTHGSYGVLCASLFGVAAALVCATVLLIAFSLIGWFLGDPDSSFAPLGYSAATATFLCGGFFSAKKRCKPLVAGVISGVILSVIFVLVSLLIDASLSAGLSSLAALSARVALICVSVVGAILGSNSGGKRKKRKTKKHRG